MLLRRKPVVIVLAMLSVSMLLLHIPARADEKEARHDLEAIYAKVDQATKNKDVKSLRAYMAEDFSMKREDGKVLNRNESLDVITQSLGQVGEIQSSTTTIDKLKEEDGTVVADTTQILKATIDGQDSKSHQLVATAKSRDTWIHTEHGWLIKHSDDLGQSATMDGKPLGQ
jgi:ketosteroid isomerase-like protein